MVVYSLPTEIYNQTAGFIVPSIFRQIVSAGGNDLDLIETHLANGNVTYDVGDRDQEPDQSMKPASAPPGVIANLVIEIAYKHESWDLLIEKLERWMNAGVHVAIRIQIGRTHRRILVLQADRGPQQVDFHIPENLTTVTLRLGSLYHGVAIPLALDGHEDDDIVIVLERLLAMIDRFVPQAPAQLQHLEPNPDNHVDKHLQRPPDPRHR